MDRDDLKRSVRIEDVLIRHGVKLYGGHRCRPICHDASRNSKNAAYNDTMYTCYVCNVHHDIFSLEMELSHCDFATAFQILGGTYEHEDKTAVSKKIKEAEREKKLKSALNNKHKADEMAIRKRLREANTVIRAAEGMMSGWVSDEWVGAKEYADALLIQQICEQKLNKELING